MFCSNDIITLEIRATGLKTRKKREKYVGVGVRKEEEKRGGGGGEEEKKNTNCRRESLGKIYVSFYLKTFAAVFTTPFP
jgi:hypothetical protein